MIRVRIWGARGSVPAPGPQMNRFGGNTSCVQLIFDDENQLILDAGTGIRGLGLELADASKIGILLTHLHLDHIQGLMFFPPCFRSEAEITIWGPSSPEATLESRIARYISAPLSPVEVRELPCSVAFRDAPATEWRIGGVTVTAEPVTHRGPTLGYRITDGETTVCYISAPLSPVEVRELPCSVAFRDAPATEWRIGGVTVTAEPVTHRGPTLGYRITDGETTVCYIPDHEPALGSSLAHLDAEWISGYRLAAGADLLIHDCQYADGEYEDHVGWGHSAVGDALTFADRVGAKRALLFHHDPLHTDAALVALEAEARARWADLGHQAGSVALAREGTELRIGDEEPLAHAKSAGRTNAGTSAASEFSTPG